MNREQRLKLLAESLSEAASAAERELTDKQKVERIAAAVRAKLTAETSKEYPQCPHCGGVLEGWRPNESTSGVDEDDPDNEPDDDDDNIEELDAAGKSKVVAELLKNRRIR